MDNQSLAESHAYDEKRAAAYNKTTGDLEGFDCLNCLNKGHTMEIRNGELYTLECSCMNTRRSMRRMERSGLGQLLEDCTMDKYMAKEPWQKHIKDNAQEFLREQSKWFYIGGSRGAGKTHICTAICRELMFQGREVRYMLWKDDGRLLKATVNETGHEEQMNRFKLAEVLYIDDLFKTKEEESVTAGDVNLAFELINARYNSGLATIISSEKTIDEILKIDEAIGSRIFQRAAGYRIELEGDKNMRLQP